MDQKQATAAQRYAALEGGRDPFLDRGRDCAALTVPYLLPPSGFSPNSKLDTPFQSLGARGQRVLSSKLLLSLFPPNTPFFRYQIDDQALQQLTQSDQMRGTVEQALSSREKAVLAEMESALFRPAAFTTLQHLIVVGNVLVYVPPKGRVRVFRLDQYVVKRDASGNLLEIVVKESVARAALPREAAAALADKLSKGTPGDEQKDLDLYTRIHLEGGMWRVYQEICDIVVPGSTGSYTPDALPWLPLRLSVQPGEDYGRSYVEEYLGDLDSLEGLVEAIVEGSAATARVIFVVSPNGTVQLRQFAKARTGDTIAGSADDVGVIQTNRQVDLSVARQQATDIAQSLSYAFMLNAAVQRSGERVTAEEIRYMASELDDALGGVYTLLGAEFQLPVVRLFERRMEKNRQVPPLPHDLVQPQIVTGLQAIGRGYDQQNLKLFVADILQVLGPELAMKFLNPQEFLKRSAASYGIDPGGLLASDEQLAQQEQQAQMMQLVQQLGPQALQQLGGMAQTQMKIDNPPPAKAQ
ncbi:MULTISPECIES: portal protein [unclassified Xanthobacter]|uniref:portal protein n=1 Tax=unclassified Xanthobacter TaxID=2623496 RepID=UPI001F230E96|nr:MULTISPECIES: portal protein [unclassified Xanthobacter]